MASPLAKDLKRFILTKWRGFCALAFWGGGTDVLVDAAPVGTEGEGSVSEGVAVTLRCVVTGTIICSNDWNRSFSAY